MDERKKQILVIAMYWCLYMLIHQVLSIQALVLGYENGEVCIVCSNVGIHVEEKVN